MRKTCLRLSVFLCLLLFALTAHGNEAGPFEGWWKNADPERASHLQLSLGGTASLLVYSGSGSRFLWSKSLFTGSEVSGNTLVLQRADGVISEWRLSGDTLTSVEKEDAPSVSYIRQKDFAESEAARGAKSRYAAMYEKPVLDIYEAPAFLLDLTKGEIVIQGALKSLIDASSLQVMNYLELMRSSDWEIKIVAWSGDELYILEIDPQFGLLNVRSRSGGSLGLIELAAFQ